MWPLAGGPDEASSASDFRFSAGVVDAHHMPDIETLTAPEDLTDFAQALAWGGRRIARDVIEQTQSEGHSGPLAA